MSTNQSLSKQAMTLIIARGISFVLTLGIPLVLVRYLTQTEFGAYKQSILLYTTVVSLLPWGMSQSLYYFIPKEPEQRAGYLANSFLFLLTVGLFALVGFFFGGPLLERYFHSAELAENSPILGLYTFFMIASLYGEIVLVSESRTFAASGVILLNEVAKAVALIGGAVVAHSFRGIMIGMAIAAAVRFLFLTIYFGRDLKSIVRGPNFELLRRQWHYSMPFGMMVLFVFIQDYFHQYYISYSFSPAEFAIYAVGCLQLPMVELFYSSIGDVAMVKMAVNLRENDKNGVRSVWHEAMLKLAVIFLPLAIYMAVASKQFITALFTTRYQASVPIFLVTLSALPLMILFVDPMMRVFGETRFMLALALLRLPLTVTLVIAALGLFGMIGAAASTLLTLLLVRVMMLLRISKLMDTGFKDLLPWRSLARILAVAVIAAIPTEALLLELSLSPKFALLVTSPIFGLIYLFAGLWIDIFPAEERRIAKRAFWRFVAVFNSVYGTAEAKKLTTETQRN